MAKKSKKNAIQPVAKPVAKSAKTKFDTPRVEYRQNGNCVVRHMEYVQDFSALAYPGASVSLVINPQVSTIFSWLSAIATRFEMYKFHKLKFMYKPSCATTTSGFIAMGVDFDDYDAIPAKNVLLAWKMSAKGPLWDALTLDISAESKKMDFKYCNYSAVGDKRIDNLGHFVALIASSTTTFAGELFVEYEVEFKQPAMKAPLPLSASFSTANIATTSIWDFVNWANFPVVKVSAGVAQIQSAGKFLLLLNNTTGSTASPTASITVPVSSPSSDATLTLQDTTLDATNESSANYLLDVRVPPINLTTSFPGGTGAASVRFATFFNPNSY